MPATARRRGRPSLYGSDLPPLDEAKAIAGDAAYHAEHPELEADPEPEKAGFLARLQMAGARLSQDPGLIQQAEPEFYAPQREQTRRILQHWGEHQAGIEKAKQDAAEKKMAAHDAASAYSGYQLGMNRWRQLHPEGGDLEQAHAEVLAGMPAELQHYIPAPKPPSADLPPAPAQRYDPIAAAGKKEAAKGTARNETFAANTPNVVDRAGKVTEATEGGKIDTRHAKRGKLAETAGAVAGAQAGATQGAIGEREKDVAKFKDDLKQEKPDDPKAGERILGRLPKDEKQAIDYLHSVREDVKAGRMKLHPNAVAVLKARLVALEQSQGRRDEAKAKRESEAAGKK